ncbi:dephospho-CoA kinase [Georgenia thermotolerans]|uniref:Dephospho-CoA kinase n=1 Tax=Georgenia thermotolerans TaxID=527326 RepID=A0A7J5UTA4_9MICO|nr:dephospho-CoA kinase [Georgenia thermotolerans]KAE8765423.1 dephospho-CoA kinase [Georgenia thermotolerans]
MLTIGLTGGIGSGKSTVSAELARLGAVVIDADRIARDVVAPGTPGLAAVVDAFGADVLAADGSLDRPALGRRVFADPEALRRLGEITHPLIKAETARREAAAPPDAIVVHDVPLIVENRLADAYDLVVVVGAREEVRLERLVRDRGMTPEDARARIRAQATDAERRAVADVWLDNSGTVEDLLAAVDAVWRERIVPAHDRRRTGGSSGPRAPRGAARS